MKKLIIALFVLLFTATFACAKDYMVMKQAGDYMVHVTINKNPPVTGDNRVDIAIQDKTGADVTDAVVNIEYTMPAMAGMPAMNYKSATELKDKQYTAKLNFSMAGAWGVSIIITRAGKSQSVKFNVDVS